MREPYYYYLISFLFLSWKQDNIKREKKATGELKAKLEIVRKVADLLEVTAHYLYLSKEKT